MSSFSCNRIINAAVMAFAPLATISIVCDALADVLTPRQPLKESYILDSTLAISGTESIINFTANYEDSRATFGYFSVWIPTTTLPNLCVDITSADGRYRAELIFDISNRTLGEAEFEFQSNTYSALLEKYQRFELGLVAFVASHCQDQSTIEQYIPIAWPDDAFGSDYLLYFNSMNLVARLLFFDQSAYQVTNCSEIPFLENSIRFNIMCPLSAPNIMESRIYLLERLSSSGMRVSLLEMVISLPTLSAESN